ncbi:hypothetical protein FRC07_006798 [Ceratobasidium sp. 392]|nr:hypothetical protein FRC07_006798 [Ceratobasidium sp. 392]
MAGIMLRSLALSLGTERARLPFISDSLGHPTWSHPGTDASLASGGSKTKHTPESHRASPYQPLVWSSSGYGSAAGSKRVAASALTSTRSAQSLRRTASLSGSDSLAALQAAADNAKCSPLIKQPRLHRTCTGSSLRPLRPTQTLVNLDVLVCLPPAPPPRCDNNPHPPLLATPPSLVLSPPSPLRGHGCPLQVQLS